MAIHNVMRATDAIEEKIRFPNFVQPKIDGVRAENMDGNLYSRTLKQHRNTFTTIRFSQEHFAGFDGEMTCGPINAIELCRKTTSALSTILGEPEIMWNLFDYVTEETIALPYYQRYQRMLEHYSNLVAHRMPFAEYLQPVPSYWVENLDQLHYYEDLFLDQGMEGLIIRDPYGKYKMGYSTVKEGGLLRIKRFVDAEAEVLSLEEAMVNLNEAQINEQGYQFRSSHQENLIGAGRVGTLICRDLKTNQIIRVTASMAHEQAIHFWLHPEEIVGKIITYKHFPKGRKDKPRFPTFKCIRGQEDI